MGWSFPWYSSGGTTFGGDFGVNPPDGVRARRRVAVQRSTDRRRRDAGHQRVRQGHDGRIGLTYQTFARGLEPLNSTYAILDLTPNGRDEDDLPWPMAWLRRHDQYDVDS